MSEEKITYFGYGANSHPDMIEAIIGRLPKGEPAILNDFELTVQQPHEIPDVVQGILQGKWTLEEIANFETYAIRRKQGAQVIATAWELTPKERELVDNWELNDGLWYQKTPVTVQTLSGGFHVPVEATTEIIDDPTLMSATDLRPDLPPFVNSKDRMLEVANTVREEYLAQN